MSEQTISEKSRQIREETAKYANTRGRVADVLDDINETKANKEDLDAAINDTLTPLVERVNAVEQSNTTQDTAIAGKLDKTTTTITEPNTEFKYAYLTNESNETRRMLAGDLGKNVANSKPTSVAGAGLNMGAIWEVSTNNFPLRIKGLPDKSADTTFNKMMVQNADGQNAWSNGSNILISAMTAMSDAQKDSYRIASRKTGENYSTGQPRIDIILPNIITKKIEGVQYVSLIGLNLFLNTNSVTTSVVMINTSTLAEYVVNNIQVSQNNQQIITIGLDFSNIPEGNYRFRITHSGLTNIDSSQFSVTNSDYERVDFSNLNWDKITTNAPFATSYASGNYVFRDDSVNSEIPTTDYNTRGLAFVSDSVLSENEANGDWIVNFTIEQSILGLGSYMPSAQVGIIDSAIRNIDINTLNIAYGINVSGGNSQSVRIHPNGNIAKSSGLNGSLKCIIQKRGSVINVIAIDNGTNMKINTYSITSPFLGIKLCVITALGMIKTGPSPFKDFKIGTTFELIKL